MKEEFDGFSETRYAVVMIHGLAVGCGCAVAVLMLAEWRGIRPLRAASKTAAALLFVLYAVFLGAFSMGIGGSALLAGLGLSVVGDLCLLSDKNRVFRLGILAFLMAHVAYIGLFAIVGVAPLWVGLGALSVGILGFVVGRALSPFVGNLKGAVYAYILVICAMVAMAIGMAATGAGSGQEGLLFSAVAFFLSDLCVARERFVMNSIWNKIVGLPLYFGAQLGFAWFGVQVLS